jgi:hypothetical protein
VGERPTHHNYDRLPIPSLLSLGAVHQHLLKTQQRPKVALMVECGDAREVHDFTTLLGNKLFAHLKIA